MLRRMLILSAAALSMVSGFYALVVSPAAAADEAPPGFDPAAMVVLCERYYGWYFEGDLRPMYRYGCELPDGYIGCLESTECFFEARDVSLPPFEEDCKVGGGIYTIRSEERVECDNGLFGVVIVIPRDMAAPNVQPMPTPPPQPDPTLAATREASK